MQLPPNNSPAPKEPETFAFPAQPDVVPVIEPNIPHDYQMRSRYFVSRKYSGLPIDITIPIGFYTDLASAPQFTWSLIGVTPDGLWRAAAITHDWLYNCGGRVYVLNVGWFNFSRKDCDKVLRSLMLASGCSRFKTWETYYAVRLFGSAHFKAL